MARSLISIRGGEGAGYLKNLDRVLAKLARIPDAVREELRKELAETARDIVTEMKARAPVAPEFERHPGELREHIASRPGRMELAVQVVCDPRTEHGVGYAPHVEFGHRTKDGGHVPPKPFFYPVLREQKRKAARRIRAAAKRGMQRAWS